jgi:hypothetical protein
MKSEKGSRCVAYSSADVISNRSRFEWRPMVDDVAFQLARYYDFRATYT